LISLADEKAATQRYHRALRGCYRWL